MKLLISVFVSILYLTAAQRIRCESFCRFRLCANLIREGPQVQPDNRALLLSIPNEPLGPIPCLVTANGFPRLLSNVTGGEATVSKEFSLDPYVPISKYLKNQIDPDFPSNYFSYIFNPGNGQQSIARIPSQGNQDGAIDQVCVRMPVSSFNLLRNDGSIRRTVTPQGAKSCIGFRTQVPKLVVAFQWFSANDFDLRLVEPNGLEINRFGTRQSPNGGQLVFDAGGRTCGVELGREQIRYLRRDDVVVEPGTYTIKIDHLRECSRRSRFTLKVFYRGRLIVDEAGFLSTLGEDVLVRYFEIPEREREHS